MKTLILSLLLFISITSVSQTNYADSIRSQYQKDNKSLLIQHMYPVFRNYRTDPFFNIELKSDGKFYWQTPKESLALTDEEFNSLYTLIRDVFESEGKLYHILYDIHRSRKLSK